MANHVLYNEYHATTATVRPAWGGTLSHEQVRRAWRKLCGVAGCTCGGPAGERPVGVECVRYGAVDAENIYKIIPIT